MSKQKIIVILGPNAAGKTSLSINLAKLFNGEIISADSRQVYKGMDLGTGKITKKEMAGIPHYLLDVFSPKSRFTAAHFKIKAEKAINKIAAKGRLPFIVGGTGFYIQTVVEGIEMPAIKPNLKLRASLEKKTTEELFLIFKKLDKKYATKIDKKNKRRLIRAIEIVSFSGKSMPKIKKKKLFDVLYLGVTHSKEILKERIAKRLLERLEQGMIAEVYRLKESGVSWKKLDEFGLEYRWISRFLKKEISKEEMIEKLQKDIEHYAKRQMTWFRKNKEIIWLKNTEEAEDLIKKFLYQTK